jgi:hypothetical protein
MGTKANSRSTLHANARTAMRRARTQFDDDGRM